MKKLLLIAGGIILFLLFLNSLGGNNSATLPASTIAPTPTPLPTSVIVVPTPTPDSGLDTVPNGASAICRDGTYSFSQHRRGTCSHHGGVAQWL
ncbi:MAG TPA: DUF3761 domain-containing protein [Patescibacteria group bacterium]|nr:DUF3761 domain-containing protein [Patescibacteria group bacterium]